ncbi:MULTISPECIES: hypothetical protein [Eikenella]|nr:MULTISPECIES: hypothetical protein [Eikenella]
MADSFWLHNGSVMRLQAEGNARVFSYENPTARMRGAGVKSGTVLFEGQRRGNRYTGQARVFSSNCGELVYNVSGNVVTERRVVLTGTREQYNASCQPTGRFVTDRLVFTYQYSE